MKKVVFWTVLIFVIVGFILVLNFNKETDIRLPNDLLFSKESGWGPCINDPNDCYQSIFIYKNGSIIKQKGSLPDEINVLSVEEIDSIIAKILETKILEKDCEYDMVLDYWATYVINLDKERILEYPACENELGEIDDLISDILKN